MPGLDWIDDFMPTPEGVALKGAREEGISLKQWVTIHGHPVNIGGSSSGSGGGGGGSGGKPSKAGPSGTATEGAMKGPHADTSTEDLTKEHDRLRDARDAYAQVIKSGFHAPGSPELQKARTAHADATTKLDSIRNELDARNSNWKGSTAGGPHTGAGKPNRVAGDINSAEMKPRASDMKPLKPEPKMVDSAAKPVKHRKPAGSF